MDLNTLLKNLKIEWNKSKSKEDWEKLFKAGKNIAGLMGKSFEDYYKSEQRRQSLVNKSYRQTVTAPKTLPEKALATVAKIPTVLDMGKALSAAGKTYETQKAMLPKPLQNIQTGMEFLLPIPGLGKAKAVKGLAKEVLTAKEVQELLKVGTKLSIPTLGGVGKIAAKYANEFGEGGTKLLKASEEAIQKVLTAATAKPQVVAGKPITEASIRFLGRPKTTELIKSFVNNPNPKTANDLLAVKTVQMAQTIAKRAGVEKPAFAHIQEAFDTIKKLAPKVEQKIINKQTATLNKTNILQGGEAMITPAQVAKMTEEPYSKALRLTTEKMPNFTKASQALIKHIPNWENPEIQKTLQKMGFTKAPEGLAEKGKLNINTLLTGLKGKAPKLAKAFPEIPRRLKEGLSMTGAAGELQGKEIGSAVNKLITNPEMAGKVASALRGELPAREMTAEIKAIINSPAAKKGQLIFQKLGKSLEKSGLLPEGMVAKAAREGELKGQGAYLPRAYNFTGTEGAAAKELLKRQVGETPLLGRMDVERLMKEKVLSPEVRAHINQFENPGLAFSRGIGQEYRLAKMGAIAKDIAENPKYAALISKEAKPGFKPVSEEMAKKLPMFSEKFLSNELHGLLEDLTLGGGKLFRAMSNFLHTPLVQGKIAGVEFSPSLASLNQAWKRAKTIWEVPTFYIRNLMSGFMQGEVLGGIPLTKMIPAGIKSLTQVAPTWIGKEAPEALKEARRIGATGGTYTKSELANLSGVKVPGQAEGLLTGADLTTQLGKAGDWIKKAYSSPKEFINAANEARLTIAAKPAQATQATEEFMRNAIYQYWRGQGKTPGSARKIADYAMIDYADVGKTVKFLRESPIGMPFVTYMLRMIPRFAKAAVGIHPLAKEMGFKTFKIPKTNIEIAPAIAAKMAKYWGVPVVTEEIIRRKLKVSREDLKNAKSGYLDTGVPGVVLLVGKNKEGKPKILDFTYNLPYGGVPLNEQDVKNLMKMNLAELPLEIRPGGTAAIGLQAALNQDWFTGKKIATGTEPFLTQQKKKLDFLAKSLLPGITPPVPGLTTGGYRYKKIAEAATNMPSETGQVKDRGLALLDAILAIKVREVDPNIAVQGRMYDIKKRVADIKKDYAAKEREIQKLYEAISKGKNKVGTQKLIDKAQKELRRLEDLGQKIVNELPEKAQDNLQDIMQKYVVSPVLNKIPALREGRKY